MFFDQSLVFLIFSRVPINAMLLVDENIFATGDDEGTLKVWDMRRGTSFMDLKHHDDYISDITVDQAKRILLTARCCLQTSLCSRSSREMLFAMISCYMMC